MKTLMYVRQAGEHVEHLEYRDGIFGFKLYHTPDISGSFWHGAETMINSVEDFPPQFEFMGSKFTFNGYGDYESK